ncbi:unnamed protein product, partial [Musa banksii]
RGGSRSCESSPDAARTISEEEGRRRTRGRAGLLGLGTVLQNRRARRGGPLNPIPPLHLLPPIPDARDLRLVSRAFEIEPSRPASRARTRSGSPVGFESVLGVPVFCPLWHLISSQNAGT